VQIGSTEKLLSRIDWEPVITIEQTLRDLLEYWEVKLRKKDASMTFSEGV
jgi:nucleoside-diphosphate-sugar epimerase